MIEHTPYAKLDLPQVQAVLFHPRTDQVTTANPLVQEYTVEVEPDVTIDARFHLAGKDDPNILFFHGNGEIVSDYDDVGTQFVRQGLSLLAVDYRGYGKSTGTPAASAMMSDSLIIYKEIRRWLENDQRTGPLLVMGRSLGSASAIEVAFTHQDEIAALIIESGFALTMPLLLTLGVDVNALGITENDGFRNVQKIEHITKPTYILHAQYDQIIPLASAEILQAQSPARSKEFQIVPGADHNTIMSVAGDMYFQAIKMFTNKIRRIRPKRYVKKRS